MNINIENMTSPNGNKVANQFVIETGDGVRVFRSYTSNIARIDADGNVTLDATYWDYSATTSKYRNLFLGNDTATCRRLIKSGVYKLDDLNSRELDHEELDHETTLDRLNKIDLGDLCVHCRKSTAFGSGRFVNRYPVFGLMRGHGIEYTGYCCNECELAYQAQRDNL